MKRRDCFRLTHRLMTKHRMQYLLMILSIGIYCGAFVLVQIVQGCLLYTEQEMRLDKFGHFSGINVNVRAEAVNPKILAQEDGGLLRMQGTIPSATYGSAVVLGGMDEKAAEMLGVSCKEGRLPQTPGEIALMYRDYIRLDRLVFVGETLTLPVQDTAGKVTERSFILCGILHDYNEQWDSAFSAIPEAFLPTALTCGGESGTLCAVYGERYFRQKIYTPENWFGGDYYQNWFLLNGDSAEHERTDRYTYAAWMMRLLLAVLLYFGCRSVTEAFYCNHFRTTQLLRCIGMNRAGLFRVFLSIAVMLSLCSIAAGIAGGWVFSGLAVWLLRRSGIRINYQFSAADSLIAAAAVFVILLAIFALHISRFLKKPEITVQIQQKRRKPREYSSFSALYRRTVGRVRNRQMRFQTVMLTMTACVFFSAAYFSDVYAEDVFHELKQESGAIPADFAFLPIGGGAYPEYLNLEPVRDYGLTAEQIEQISAGGSAKVTFAVTGQYATAFLHWNDAMPNAALHQLHESHSFRRELNEMQLDADAVFANAGLTVADDLLTYNIFGISAEQLKEADPVSGSLNFSAYQNGEEAVVFQGDHAYFQPGDTVELYIFEYDNARLHEPGYTPRLTAKTVRISAVYAIRAEDDSQLNRFLLRSAGNAACLFVSDQLMLSADRELNYDTVFADRCDASAEAVLLDIYRECRHGTYAFRNYTDLAGQQRETAAKYRIPFLILAWLLVGMILCSYMVSDRTIRSMNAKSDFLLTAVGLRRREMLLAIRRNHLTRCARACLYGFGLFAGIILIVRIPVHLPVLTGDCLKTVMRLLALSAAVTVTGSLSAVRQIYGSETAAGLRQE